MSKKNVGQEEKVMEEKVVQEETTTDEANEAEEKVEEVEEEKKPLSKEEETFKTQLQRLQAEFLNYKKRVEREKGELSLFVKGEFVKRFLPVLDDVSRVKSNIDADEKTLKGALEMVFKKVDEFQEKESISFVGEIGETFNPELHEALMQVPTEDDEKDETVASVFEPGYKIGDKILRFAKVQVYQKQ